jgi:quercetin dioxygenase-like cupin family protein
MSPESIYVDAQAEEWRETPYVGVTFKKLLFERETGRSTVLVRFEPETRYGAHRHPEGEEYYVLEGSLEDGGRTWGAGSYVYHPPGSAHRPTSKEGCVLLIVLPKPIDVLDEKECRELMGHEGASE